MERRLVVTIEGKTFVGSLELVKAIGVPDQVRVTQRQLSVTIGIGEGGAVDAAELGLLRLVSFT